MAIRTDHNPFGLTLTVSFSDFAKREGRGRPQTNPYVTIDFSEDLKDLLAKEGEKRIRNEAFKLLREQMCVNPKAAIVPNPKGDGRWIIKDDSCRTDVYVIVSGIEVEDDNIFG